MFIVSAAALVLICMSIQPLRDIGVGFFRFVRQNAWTNDVAHGYSFSEGLTQRDPMWGVGSTELLWHISRHAWVIVTLFGACLFWREFRREPHLRRPSLLIMAGCTSLMLLFTVPWILGRIEIANFGRPGSLSHLAVYWLLPPMVLLAVSRKRLVGALLALAIFVGVLYPSNPTNIDPASVSGRAVMMLQIPRCGRH